MRARWVDILPFVILHWLLYTRCAAAGTARILVDILVDRVDMNWKKLDFTNLGAAAERAKYGSHFYCPIGQLRAAEMDDRIKLNLKIQWL